LVLRIEKLFERGLIAKETEMFILTVNWVTEICFLKGHIGEPLLFDSSFGLTGLEMKGDLSIHLVWVAGTRMLD
jgi:hypothetical protein